MYLIDTCPCCDARVTAGWPAMVSPFLADRALRSAPSSARLLECRHCHFRFFDVRLEDAEIARLYDGYRGDAYFRQRHAHEWWYSRRTNDRIGSDAGIASQRRSALTSFLAASIDLSTVDRVLDYGGDRGQFIPEGLGRERVVYEFSGVEAVDSVRGVTDLSALNGQRFDLVLVAHVLEHVSDPAGFLRTLGNESFAKDALIYIEVPLERPRFVGTLRGRLGGAWVGALLRRPRALRAVQFYSTASRVALNVVPPLGVTNVHEHLNFFDGGSLRSLLERLGFHVTQLRQVGATVRALARLGGAAQT